MSYRATSILFLVTVLAVLGPASVHAQTCDPQTGILDDCTLEEIYDFHYAQILSAETADEVVDSNRATTAPDPFASRLHASYQDFLNMFSFAVNDVEESEDGQALIVRFNPLRQGLNLLGLSLTLAKPTVGQDVSDAIDEDQRTAVLEKVEAQMGDLDDQTWSLAYSLATPRCSWEKSRCFGRQPSTYRQMLSSVLEEIAPALDDARSFELIERLADLSRQDAQAELAITTSISDFAPQDQVNAVEAIRELAEVDAAGTLLTQAAFQASGIEQLASLIDNQPQFALTGSYRALGQYGGPDEVAVSLEFQFGPDNLNSVINECGTSATCAVNKLKAFAENGLSTDKFVLSASYKEREKFSLEDLGLDSPVSGFEPINLPRSSELQAKIQWGRQLKLSVGQENARLDISGQGIRTRGDATRRENRWVGTATLTVPLGEQMSIPLSLTYANKPEFLGEQNERLGMHFGLSWRLPFAQPTSP